MSLSRMNVINYKQRGVKFLLKLFIAKYDVVLQVE